LNRLRPLKSQGRFCRLRGKRRICSQEINLIIRGIKSHVKVFLYYMRSPSGTIENTTPVYVIEKKYFITLVPICITRKAQWPGVLHHWLTAGN
jgi:hypothetical protein